MNKFGRSSAFAAITVAASLSLNGWAVGQEAQAPPPVLAIQSSGVDALLSSPKDRALRDLLHQLAPRLSELPAELSRFGIQEASEIPPGTFETVWQLYSRPQAMELRLNLGRLRDQQLPVDVRWAVETESLQAASDTIGFARNLLRESPLNLRPGSEPGGFIAETPAMPLYFGAKRSGEQALLYFSTEEDGLPDMSASYVALPEGVDQFMGIRFDLGQLTPVIGMPVGMAPPFVGEMLMEAGLIGWDATRFDFAAGFDDKAMHSVARMSGAARSARMLVADPERTLTRADFALVPGDATMASLGFYDASKTWDLAVRVLQNLGVWEDVQKELRTNLDLDLRNVEEIVRSLGDTWVTYQSDTTGGGEFSSLIVSASVRDAATLETALATAAAKANALGRDQAKGYVRVRSWEHEGGTILSFNTPGLPIPAEPSLAIRGDRLLIAMSVPSLMAAIDQHRSGERSLHDRADIRTVAGGSFEGISGFSFTDTERYARRGYGTMNHLVAGLANGVRSPLSDREPYQTGPMMPSYSVLMNDIIPAVTVTRWDGEDLVITGIADRSITVHLAAGMGKANFGAMAGQFVPMMFAGAGSGFARTGVNLSESSSMLRSTTQVRTVAMMASSAASEEGGYPASVNDLVDAGWLSSGDLQSPYGSMMDGTPDIVMRGDLAGQEPSFSATEVLVLDRSALNFEGESAVGFSDGHAEWLSRDQIIELLKRPENKGAAEAFGL